MSFIWFDSIQFVSQSGRSGRSVDYSI